MAVQAALRMWSRAASNVDSQDNFRRFDVGFTEAFQILHDVGEPEVNKYSAPGLPAAGSVYPGTNFVLAGRARMQQVSPIMTVATVEYRGEIAPSNGSGPPSSNPISAPPTIDWDTILSEEEIDEDIYGKPIVTAAGERVRGIKAEFPDLLLTVNRNFAFWNSYTQAAFARGVNSLDYANWPPGTGRVVKLKASSVIGDPGNGFGYWRATLQVKFRIPWRTTPNKAWFARWFHQGYKCKKRIDGDPDAQGNNPFKIVPCVDGHKSVSTSPRPLDVNGFQVEDNDESQFNWRETERYIPMDLNLLGFL
ncbi:hypothetical protein SH449x_000754 [Pirellulaceae bacterium SH449]